MHFICHSVEMKYQPFPVCLILREIMVGKSKMSRLSIWFHQVLPNWGFFCLETSKNFIYEEFVNENGLNLECPRNNLGVRISD